MVEQKEIDQLAQTLSHKDRMVRIDTVKKLKEIGGTVVVGTLIQAVKDMDFGVRAFAIEALGEIGDPRALETLIQALKDASYSVRRDAAKALGALGDASAIEALTIAMKRHDTGFCVEDDRVFEAAKEAIEKINLKGAAG